MATTTYFSYLIRIWKDDRLLEDTWMASLEDPSTKHILYFKTLEELFAFLRSRSHSDKDQAKTHTGDPLLDGHKLINEETT